MKPAAIGPYRITDTLFEDGWTVTYRGHDAALGRHVLVRTHRGHAAPGSPTDTRLLREARTVARLSHPAIWVLHGMVRTPPGTSSSGIPPGSVVLLGADVPGHHLSEVIARASPIDARAAVAIAIRLGEGLAHMHGRGLVLTDLRPERVIVGPTGSVVIMDLAAAREPGSAPPPEDAMPLGAPTYLAPEVVAGGEVGAKSDLYSLGVVLQEMLGAPREGVTGADADLRELVARAITKSPAERPRDVASFVVDLEAWLRGWSDEALSVWVLRALSGARLFSDALPPIPDRPAGRGGRGRSIRKLAYELAAAGAIACVGGLVTMWLRGEPPAPPPSETDKTQPGARGNLRVLARPWAELWIDGEWVDTTPVGRPIPLAPGRHHVAFRHPAAPEETRQVTIPAGQTVLVDVTMQIVRPERDAGAKAPEEDTP